MGEIKIDSDMVGFLTLNKQKGMQAMCHDYRAASSKILL
jgi:hypothetical protein